MMHFLFPPGCDLGRGVDLNYFTIVSVRINNSSVSCVPFSASHDAIFSVSFGDNRRSDSGGQGRLRKADSRSTKVGGVIFGQERTFSQKEIDLLTLSILNYQPTIL
jgi:hypothetical protein